MPKLSKEEQKRRKDITKSGVAQEALDKFDELEAKKESSSEVFTKHGYRLSQVLKLAIKERNRIYRELEKKPLKDVKSDILDMSKIKLNFDKR
jgi:hypothetical protein